MWGENWGEMIWGGGSAAAVQIPFGPWTLLFLGFILGVCAVYANRSRMARVVPFLMVLLVPVVAVVAVNLPNTFSNGTVADANQVNTNFKFLGEAHLILTDSAGSVVGPAIAAGNEVIWKSDSGEPIVLNVAEVGEQAFSFFFTDSSCSGPPHSTIKHPSLIARGLAGPGFALYAPRGTVRAPQNAIIAVIHPDEACRPISGLVQSDAACQLSYLHTAVQGGIN